MSQTKVQQSVWATHAPTGGSQVAVRQYHSPKKPWPHCPEQQARPFASGPHVAPTLAQKQPPSRQGQPGGQRPQVMGRPHTSRISPECTSAVWQRSNALSVQHWCRSGRPPPRGSRRQGTLPLGRTDRGTQRGGRGGGCSPFLPFLPRLPSFYLPPSLRPRAPSRRPAPWSRSAAGKLEQTTKLNRRGYNKKNHRRDRRVCRPRILSILTVVRAFLSAKVQMQTLCLRLRAKDRRTSWRPVVAGPPSRSPDSRIR